MPLLRQLAGKRAATVFDEAVRITDDPAAIASFLLEFGEPPATKAALWRVAVVDGAMTSA